MTASTDVASLAAPARLVHRYFLAMSVPFLIDLVSLAVYAALNDAPQVLLPSIIVSAIFLVAGVGTGAWYLIRPVMGFVQGRIAYADIEHRLCNLPHHSALVVGLFYLPMIGLRLLSHRLDFTFGATLQKAGWPDIVANLTVGTGFNVVLTFFIVSAYLDRLCGFLFMTRGVNIGAFRGRFRRKVALALLFVSFSTMILIAADILSYEGARLVREATVDITTSASGAVLMYYWISQALTRPITRLDVGMRQVADGNFTVRLPVTSDDEVGHAASGFNRMVEGLAERQYLRDTFGKYVSESVAAAILDGNEHTGRAVDTTAEATLMFTDIEGFTGLSERMTPTEVAGALNTYLGTVVPVIQRHGGVVNSFIGDGLFASFNLPLPLEDHAGAALRAALEIQRSLAAVGLVPGVEVRTRIGLNTGPVIGVTIGAADRLTYTLLGDAVNVAARVEQLNKQFHTAILATESTVRAAGAERFCERLGEADVRGHRGNVVVYRVGPPS
ncbi:MAG: adenylate/guanylate cyclase domain-containing protein [Reyranella sp.]|nr:adenylate/guanylate cyclase domain-containing protein [Reyranella sp.]